MYAILTCEHDYFRVEEIIETYNRLQNYDLDQYQIRVTTNKLIVKGQKLNRPQYKLEWVKGFNRYFKLTKDYHAKSYTGSIRGLYGRNQIRESKEWVQSQLFRR